MGGALPYLRAGALGLVIDDTALRALTALARALASERRRAREMMRAFAVALALVTAPGQRRAPVTRQTGADRHLVDHFALGVLPARARLTCGFCVQLRGATMSILFFSP